MKVFLLPLFACSCLSWQIKKDEQLLLGREVLNTDNQEIRIDVTGAGPPVLMIHGFGSSLETWEFVAPVLSQHHKVIRIDLKGFGLSSKYEDDYSLSSMVDLINQVIEYMDLGKTDVMAHSYGCSVALAFAMANPEKVDHLILTDAFVYEEQMPWFFAWSRAPVIGEILFGLYYDQQLDWRIPLSFYNKEFVTHEMVTRAYDAVTLPGSKAAALAVVRGLNELQWNQNFYHTIEADTLLLWGENDEVTPINFGRRLEQQIPGATLEIIPSSGHFPMVEAYDRYNSIVMNFLENK